MYRRNVVCFRYIIVNSVRKYDDMDNNRKIQNGSENRGNRGMGMFEEVEGAEM
jgi:hypothetical protein